MKVRFIAYTFTKSIHLCFSNVDWIRITGEKLVFTTSLGERKEYYLRKISDLEVTNL